MGGEGGVVKATHRPFFPREWPGTRCIEGWVDPPGPVWTGAENLVSHGIPSPDRPARNEWLYGLS